MFGKGKLFEHGARPDGVVVDGGFDPARGFGDSYKVKVRVEFEDGSSTEITRSLNAREAGDHREGSIVPLRYDLADRSKLEIDEPALRARRDANRSRLRELAIADGGRRLQAEDRAGEGRRILEEFKKQRAERDTPASEPDA